MALSSLITITTPLVTRSNSTTSCTLQLSDDQNILEMSNSSASNVVIPTTANVPFKIGSQITVIQAGSGQVTITAQPGVSIVSESSKVKLRGQWAAATLVKRGDASWIVFGNLTA